LRCGVYKVLRDAQTYSFIHGQIGLQNASGTVNGWEGIKRCQINADKSCE